MEIEYKRNKRGNEQKRDVERIKASKRDWDRKIEPKRERKDKEKFK